VIGSVNRRIHTNCEKRFLWRSESATQLAEFAVTLPLLVVFVVGIFDFSGAFTLKQKLTNISRDAARAAAADPATDLYPSGTTGPLPYSVNDAFYVIDNYLLANNINDCGITVSDGKPSGTTKVTWVFSHPSSSGSTCGIKITINRGYYFPLGSIAPPPTVDCAPTLTGQTQVVGTCVGIQYSYQWKFGNVASLLGTNAILPSAISGVAIAMNED
jgi:Flp pilus assembly protein TadG